MNKPTMGRFHQMLGRITMSDHPPRSLLWQAAVLALAWVAIFFAWEGHQGLSLADEGYLWYGAQRVLAGEIPLRDFQSYDPGRYYWSAAVMHLAGSQSIMTLRCALTLMQMLALGVASVSLALIKPLRGGFWFLLVGSLTLAVWGLAPRHKAFDIAASIALVCAFALLIRRPTNWRYFLGGAVLGVIAYVGRNHGIYGAAGGLGVLVYLAIRGDGWVRWRRGVLCFVAGGFVGYAPMFVTMLLAHGFTAALIDSIKFIFEVKSTNLPLPIPWPWHANFTTAPSLATFRNLVIGLFFVTTLVFGLLAPLVVLLRRWKGLPVEPLLAACAFLALPYAHYGFSRADPEHLALGIVPTLIGLLTLAGMADTWRRALIALPLCVLSLIAMLPDHQGWKCMGARNCPLVEIGHDRIRADRRTVADVALFLRLQHDFAPNGRSAFVTPMQPAVSALLGIRSPTWEIYTAWPRGAAFQREEIARLEAAKPGFVLVYDVALDGREELRYRNTHPLIDDYIRKNFVPVEGYSDYPMYEIYRAR